MRIILALFNRRKHRCALAIFDRRENHASFWQAPNSTRKRNTPKTQRSDCSENLCFRVCLGALLEGQAPANAKHPKTQILRTWAAVTGGVTNGGLRGVWPPVQEIGLFRPFQPFAEASNSTWKRKKGLFPWISLVLLKPPSLKRPHLRHSNELSVFCVSDVLRLQVLFFPL